MLTYNQQEYIEQAIMSVINQRVDFDYEIIIADDCSSDDTGLICRCIAAEYPGLITLLERKHNMSLIPNFMDAYARCRGEYIAICEGDDYWTSPHKLSRQVKFLDSHPDYTIAIHRVINHYIDQGTWSLSNGGSLSHTTIAHLSRSNYISNVSAMFHRIPAEDLPGWFNQVSTYDYPLHMLNAARGKIYYDKRSMAVYRQHSHAIWSQAGTIKKLEMARSVRALMINHFKETGNAEAVDGLLPAYRAVCIAMIKADNDNRATYINLIKHFYPDITADEIDKLVTAPPASKSAVKRLMTSCRKIVSRVVPINVVTRLLS